MIKTIIIFEIMKYSVLSYTQVFKNCSPIVKMVKNVISIKKSLVENKFVENLKHNIILRQMCIISGKYNSLI